MVPVELGRKVVSGTVRHVRVSSCRAVGTVGVLSGSCRVLLSSCRTGAQFQLVHQALILAGSSFSRLLTLWHLLRLLLICSGLLIRL